MCMTGGGEMPCVRGSTPLTDDPEDQLLSILSGHRPDRGRGSHGL